MGERGSGPQMADVQPKPIPSVDELTFEPLSEKKATRELEESQKRENPSQTPPPPRKPRF